MQIVKQLDKLTAVFGTSFNNADKVVIWCEKLKSFDAKTIDLAVDHAISTLSSGPSLAAFIEICRSKQSKDTKLKPIREVDILGGAAPFSVEKQEMQAKFMGELAKTLNIRDRAKREEIGVILKEEWHLQYRRLPGYKDVEELKQMVRQGRQQELRAMGVDRKHHILD